MQLNNQNQLILDKRAILKPYQPRTFKQYEIMTDAEIVAGAGGYLVIDTESYPNFFLIAFKDLATHKYILFQVNAHTGECFNERKLSWILHSYTTIGFNSHKFDNPLIWYSYANQELPNLKRATNWLINQSYYNKTEFENEFSCKVSYTPHIDLIEICPGNPPQIPGQPTRPKSLKLYMGRMHSKRIQDLPFDPNANLVTEQCEIVTDYCLNDLDGTEELYLFNKERIDLRKALGREYKTELRSKSDAQMAEAMVAKEIKQITGQWPKKADLNERREFSYNTPNYLYFATPQLQKLLLDVQNTKFTAEYGQLSKPATFESYYFHLGKLRYKFGIGGLHSCEENIAYKADANTLLIDRDVASYYPAIIINQGLYPSHLGKVFLNVYTEMRDDRIQAKKLKQFTKDKGLKIALNGVSGKFNSEHSIFYDPQCYLQMTLTGQLSILMLAEMFECSGIRVISANTDGIVSYCPQSKYDEMLQWINYWEKATGFVTEETQYKSYYASNVNAYFAVKDDLSVKVKGPYSEVGSQTGTKLDNNPICLICSDAVKALLAHNIPIEKTIRECLDLTRFLTVRNVTGGAHKNHQYLGKVVRWAYCNNIVGTINYVKSGNKVAETENAQPFMDLPETFPDINFQWYVDKATEILYDIGYLQRPKQIRFF